MQGVRGVLESRGRQPLWVLTVGAHWSCRHFFFSMKRHCRTNVRTTSESPNDGSGPTNGCFEIRTISAEPQCVRVCINYTSMERHDGQTSHIKQSERGTIIWSLWNIKQPQSCAHPACSSYRERCRSNWVLRQKSITTIILAGCQAFGWVTRHIVLVDFLFVRPKIIEHLVSQSQLSSWCTTTHLHLATFSLTQLKRLTCHWHSLLLTDVDNYRTLSVVFVWRGRQWRPSHFLCIFPNIRSSWA